MNTYVKIGGAFVLVALLGGLAGWYLYLNARTTAIEQADAARGSATDIPSSLGNFVSSVVSTVTSGGGSGGTTPPANSAVGSPENPGASPDNTAAGTTTASMAGNTTAQATTLSHVSKVPVAGFGFVEQNGAVRLYYVERATGYVFMVDLADNSTVRITNTLRPKIYEAAFDKAGVIERSLAEDGSIETFAGSFGSGTATSTAVALTGSVLSKNITALALVPTTVPALFYLREGDGGTEGILASRTGTKGNTVFASPITGWRAYARADGTLYVAQKAANNVTGFAYEVTKVGALSPLVDPTPGLIVLPRAWSSALLWNSYRDGVTLFSRASKSAKPTVLPIATIADKCAWVPPPTNASVKQPGNLTAYCAVPRGTGGFTSLEAWYQGALHTSDAWWAVDVSTGTVTAIDITGMDADVHDPVIDPSGKHITFRDGRDDSLWVLKIGK